MKYAGHAKYGKNVLVSDGGYLLVTSAQKLGREKAKKHEIYKRCVNWDGGLPHCIFSKLKMIFH